MAQQLNYGTGRRKTSTARVYLDSGNGNITVNGATISEPDIEAVDGIIHAIDAVLLPPAG